MKLLCLSDLHLCKNIEPELYKEKAEWLKSLDCSKVDAICIAGDIFEYENIFQKNFNPYKELSEIFNAQVPILCVLGNHEFFMSTLDNVMQIYRTTYHNSFNVHYLDIIGKFDHMGHRFVGNVFWYDGSMKTNKEQDMKNWADGTWPDKHIKSLVWSQENNKCVERIKANRGSILLTHHIPHWKMSGRLTAETFDANPANDYDAYSGVRDFLDKEKFKASVCGHTHKHVALEINKCKCVNVGNDMRKPWLHHYLEI